MFADLQTDPDFPAWAMDGDESSLRNQETMVRQDEVAEFLMQWAPIEITSADGRSYFVLARPSASDDLAAPWTLYQQGNQWLMRLGRIFTDPGDAEKVAPIVNADAAISVSANSVVYLEMSGFPDKYTITLKSGSRWTGYPETIEMSSKANDPPPVLKFTRFLLCRILGSENEHTAPLAKNLHAEYVRRSPDVMLGWGARAFTDGTGRRATVPILISL